MDFYYDPILGLQYTNLGEFFTIDLECLPQDIKFDTKLWMKYIRETGTQLLDQETVIINN